jgi:mono/diheme cytochrome c family protein
MNDKGITIQIQTKPLRCYCLVRPNKRFNTEAQRNRDAEGRLQLHLGDLAVQSFSNRFHRFTATALRYAFAHGINSIMRCCDNNPPSVISLTEIPSNGDAERGAVLFTTGKNPAPPCAVCHLPGAPASPDLAGFAARAGSQVAGESAAEYAFYSITEPARFITPPYGNAMYNLYDEAFTSQEIADLIAYLLTL